nr:MAG: hypothetical protein [Betatorquevirus sp.]
MSSIWRPPTSSLRQQELNWLNIVHQSHDAFCHCEDPDLHWMIAVNKFSAFQKPEIDIKNIKCLLTGATKDGTEEEETTGQKEDFGILEGELDQLFNEENEPTENTDQR